MLGLTWDGVGWIGISSGKPVVKCRLTGAPPPPNPPRMIAPLPYLIILWDFLQESYSLLKSSNFPVKKSRNMTMQGKEVAY